MTRKKATSTGLPETTKPSELIGSGFACDSTPIVSHTSNERTHEALSGTQQSARVSVPFTSHDNTADNTNFLLTKSGGTCQKNVPKLSVSRTGNKKHSRYSGQKQKAEKKSEIADENNRSNTVLHREVDNNQDDTRRKLLELSRYALSKPNETTLTNLSGSVAETGPSLQENSPALDSTNEARSATLVSSTSASISHLSCSVTFPATVLPVALVSSSAATAFPNQQTYSISRNTIQSPRFQNGSFSTPWIPHHLTDGMVPMLSLGPGLNIPLLIRPASTQLVSGMSHGLYIFIGVHSLICVAVISGSCLENKHFNFIIH